MRRWPPSSRNALRNRAGGAYGTSYPADHMVRLLDDFLTYMRDGIGQNLMSIFNKTPHKLGDWGFNIDEAAAKPKDRTLIVKPGAAKTIYKAVQQSVVKNNSTITVKIFPGKGTDGTPVELAPGASFPIKFRFGTFTVQNPSSSDAADLSATTYHT